MKRLYFLCIQCLLLVIATTDTFAWGILSEVVENPRIFAVGKLLNKTPIYYTVEGEITPENEQIFTDNIRKWPQEVARLIEQSSRQAEFRDVLPILQHPLQIKRAPRGVSPHITLKLRESPHSSSGEFVTDERSIYVNLSAISATEFERISLHEIGHYFGLADQYPAHRGNAHAEYSSNADTAEDSLMNTGKQITCDDADGFINLLDFRQYQRNKVFSNRANVGWKSLCPNSANIYKKAKTINRRYDIRIANGLASLKMKPMEFLEYDSGTLTNTYPFYDENMTLLKLFTIEQTDEVVRAEDAPYITAIHSELTVSGLPQKLRLTRKFTYTKRNENEYEIEVKKFLDDIHMATFTLALRSESSKTQTKDTYIPWSDTLKMSHELSDGSAVQWSVTNEKNFGEMMYAFLGQMDPKEKQIFDDNFYINFYVPLFGPDYQTLLQQQVLEKLSN